MNSDLLEEVSAWRHSMFSNLLRSMGWFLLILAVAQPAFASMTVTVSSGNASFTIADNDPIYDISNAIDGFITSPASLTVGGRAFEIVEKEIILTSETHGEASSFNFESRVMIPEPFSVVIWSLLGIAGAGLTMVRRRRLNARAAWSKETRDAIYKVMKL